MPDRQFGDTLIAESKRRLFEESVPRIKKCLDHLAEEDIWRRPNAETVSIGNLVVHLCGNVRQWICCGLGGEPDNRQRSKEFDERGPIPVAELVQRLDDTMRDAARVLDAVDPATLLEMRPIQGFEESGLSILVHVVEHFSYHTGQITYSTKASKAIDLAYYGGEDLERRGGPDD